MGQSRPLLVYFRPFLVTIWKIRIEKSLEGVLGIQTRGHRMVGTYKTTELWWPPWNFFFLLLQAGFSPCSGNKNKKSILGSCIARTSSEEELQNQLQAGGKRPISPGLRGTTWNGESDNTNFLRKGKYHCMADHAPETSVTRWQNCVLIFGHLQQLKCAQ